VATTALSRREAILARIAEVIAAIPGIETSGRNVDRVADSKLPCAMLFDGDEEAFENLRATGGAANVVNMTPAIVVSLGDVPENVGTVTNEWLAKVQKAILFDSMIEQLAGGRSAPLRIPNGGARYVAATTSLAEGRSSEVNLTVHFSIAYPFNPTAL
jgi:hypothetical protein